MKLLLAIAAFVALASAASVSVEDLEFTAWKLKFGKIYKSAEEEAQRKMIWLENRKEVLVHNILADQGIKSFRLGMNYFADIDIQEYRKSKLCAGSFNKIKNNSTATLIRQAGSAALPPEIDWRDYGYVTPVKEQSDHCGSCWAFSATGALEGQTAKKTGNLVSLSEQQLVDCSGSYGNMGCQYGYKEAAFDYVRDNGGLDSEDSYPYNAVEGNCMFNPDTVAATCTGYVSINQGDENALQEAVATIGPISVSIDASQASFLRYQSGVYDEPNCSSTKTNHLVLVVGYGTEGGLDYWLVKNSWGTTRWSKDGYIKMARNKNNQCAIASYAAYPLV